MFCAFASDVLYDNPIICSVLSNNKVYSIKKIGTKVQWLIDNVVVHEETLPNTGSLYYDVAFMTINGSFTDMEMA
jgi:hypothetical protein